MIVIIKGGDWISNENKWQTLIKNKIEMISEILSTIVEESAFENLTLLFELNSKILIKSPK